MSEFKPGDPCFLCHYPWPADCECIDWNHEARERHAREGLTPSSFASRKVVSEPGADITVTAYTLTPEAQRGLCTNGARLPPLDGGKQQASSWLSWRRWFRKWGRS